MRQLQSVTLTAINQVLRDIYTRLGGITQPTYRLQQGVIMSDEAHAFITPKGQVLAVLGEVSDWRVNGDRILICKKPLVFNRTENGYACISHVEVPARLTDGKGNAVRAITNEGVTEFVGGVRLQDTVYLYPHTAEYTILLGGGM